MGSAFGLMTARQSVGLLAFPYFNGAPQDATHGYTARQIMCGAIAAVGLIFAALLLHADRRSGARLERAG